MTFGYEIDITRSERRSVRSDRQRAENATTTPFFVIRLPGTEYCAPGQSGSHRHNPYP
jgi:hypothetical protein